MSEDALSRHKRNGHLPAGEMAIREAAEKASEAKGMSRVDVAMEQLAANIEARQIAKAQKRDRDEREWAKEVRFANQHLAELEGELQVGVTVTNNIVLASQENLTLAIEIAGVMRDAPAEIRDRMLALLSRRCGLVIEGEADAGDQVRLGGAGG